MVIIITNKDAVELITERLMVIFGETCAHEINIIHSQNLEDVELKLKNGERTDVLVTTPECIMKLLDSMLDMFNSERLRSIWFNETDELRLLDEKDIHRMFSAVSNKQVIRVKHFYLYLSKTIVYYLRTFLGTANNEDGLPYG